MAFFAYFYATTRYGPIRSKLNTLFGLKSAPKIVHGGYVKPGYESVRELFLRNFKEGLEIGAQCVAYVRGEQVTYNNKNISIFS